MRTETKRSDQLLHLQKSGLPGAISFDCKTGCIKALILPAGKVFCLLGRESEYIIPWECVRQVGEDIILVEIREDSCLHDCT